MNFISLFVFTVFFCVINVHCQWTANPQPPRPNAQNLDKFQRFAAEIEQLRQQYDQIQDLEERKKIFDRIHEIYIIYQETEPEDEQESEIKERTFPVVANTLGLMYKNQKDYVNAEKNYELSLDSQMKIIEEKGMTSYDIYTIMLLTFNLANLKYEIQKIDECIKNLNLAVSLYKSFEKDFSKIPPKQVEDIKEGYFRNLEFLAAVNTENDNLSKKELKLTNEYFQEAMNLVKTVKRLKKNNHYKVRIVQTYGLFLSSRLGKHEKAIQMFKTAIKKFEMSKYTLHELYRDLGKVYLNKNDIDNAEKSLLKSLKFGKDVLTSNQDYLARMYINLGQFYLTAKINKINAKKYLTAALNIYEDLRFEQGINYINKLIDGMVEKPQSTVTIGEEQKIEENVESEL